MKVLITSDLYFVKTNGVVTSLNNLADVLRKKGHEVRILTVSDKHKSYEVGDVSFIRSMPTWVYNGSIRMPTSYRHKLIKKIIEWKPDVIHSQCEFFSLSFAKYISKKTGAPIVHTYHTMYEDYVGYLFLIKRIGIWYARSKTKKVLERIADAVIVPTEKVKNKHIENGVVCEFNVIPSGIDLEQHKNPISSEERSRLREKYGLSDGDVVLLSLGRVAPEKNIDELINFYARISKTDPALKLLIVGGGPAKEELEHQARELSLEGRVVFVGMVEPDEVHKYYQLGDVFVSASTSETQGLTYIEAAANGLPLLCRRDPCLEGVIIEGENGYVYETEEQFYARLNSMLSNSEMLRTAAEASRRIAEPYDKSVFGDSVERVYEAAIKKKAEQLSSGKKKDRVASK